jgi:hypothetical protein
MIRENNSYRRHSISKDQGKLLAFKIDGKIINVDIFNWDIKDLKGNAPWVYSDSEIDGYENILSISNLNDLWTFSGMDYINFLDELELIYSSKKYKEKNGNDSVDIDSFTEIELNILCKHFIPDSEIIKKILSVDDILINWDEFNNSIKKCRDDRQEAVFRYLRRNVDDFNFKDFIVSTQSLFDFYKNHGIQSYNKDKIDGIVDWINGDFSYINLRTYSITKTGPIQTDSYKIYQYINKGNQLLKTEVLESKIDPNGYSISKFTSDLNGASPEEFETSLDFTCKYLPKYLDPEESIELPKDPEIGYIVELLDVDGNIIDSLFPLINESKLPLDNVEQGAIKNDLLGAIGSDVNERYRLIYNERESNTFPSGSLTRSDNYLIKSYWKKDHSDEILDILLKGKYKKNIIK